MIPSKKKSPEEIAALRSQIGIDASSNETEISKPPSLPAVTLPEEPTRPAAFSDTTEPVFRIEVQPKPSSHKSHSEQTSEKRNQSATSRPGQESHLPTRRHSPKEIAELRHRENVAHLSSNQPTQASILKSQTANQFLLSITYICLFSAAACSLKKYNYAIPLSLIALSTLLTLYIFFAKKRSRHHTAILVIILILTLILGSSSYPELIPYAP